MQPKIKLRSVKQVGSSSPAALVCSAYDFYPELIKVSWLRDGKEMTTDAVFIEELANGDWYYQIHSQLEYIPKPGEKISCMVKSQRPPVPAPRQRPPVPAPPVVAPPERCFNVKPVSPCLVSLFLSLVPIQYMVLPVLVLSSLVHESPSVFDYSPVAVFPDYVLCL